jgi:predicted nucleic-acid-binding protein
MHQSPIQSSSNVQADAASPTGAFVEGLLDPSRPVPTTVLGRTPKRYAVYRNNVTIGLIRAMESNFPVVRRLLGEQYFAGLAREFVQKHPPQSPLMFQYGSLFGDYLAAEEDLRDYPYLGDVARLEQRMRLSYHEADSPSLCASALTDFSEEDLMSATFKPQPAMAIIESWFAIHSIYGAHQSSNASAVEDIARPESVVVVRPVHDVALHLITSTQCDFLKSLIAGETLGVAAEVAFDHDNNFDLTRAIGLLLLPGTFQSIHIKKE